MPVHAQVKKLKHFYDSLYTHGFDLIHVDFEHSQDPIEEHAQHVLKVLQWIDHHNPKAKITLIGASMGGLVARYALDLAHRSPCCFNVRAYGAFDTPHRGAFIPVGLQAQVRRLGWNDPYTPGIKAAWDWGVNAPAARQMLRQHIDSSAAVDFAQWMTALGTALPEGVKTFTAVNGSDVARAYLLEDSAGRIAGRPKTTEVPRQQWVGTSASVLLTNATGGQVITIPKRINQSQIHRHPSKYLFEYSKRNYAKRMQMKWLNAFSARGAYILKAASLLLPNQSAFLDTAIVHLQRATNTRLDSIFNKLLVYEERVPETNFATDWSEAPGSYTHSAASLDLLPGFQVYSEGHCFVPTFSALNVDPTYTFLPVRNRMDLIPFDAYYAPGVFRDGKPLNEEHVRVGQKNSSFMLDQVRSVYRNWAPGGVLPGNYNIAKEHEGYGSHESHIDYLEVPFGRTLFLAGKGRVRGQDATEPYAALDQHVVVHLGTPCRPGNLLVAGTVKLGDSERRKAVLKLHEGSTLRLASGAVLMLSDESNLDLAPSAQLIVEPGAKVVLNGGIVKWRGQVILLPNATFKPEGSGSIEVGRGAQLQAASGSSVHLGSSGMTALQLEVPFEWPHSLDFCILDSTSVTLAMGASLFCASPLLMNYSSFSSLAKDSVYALQASGKQLDLRNTSFYFTEKALRIGATCAATVENCAFYSCDTAVKAERPLVSLSNCVFQDCSLGASLVSGSFSIEHCLFANGEGLKIRAARR